MDDLVGKQLGHYRVDALLGEGGMGAVYRAYDLHLDRTVALKVMHRHLARESRFQQRFMQEAQAAARLSHPSIVGVHDFGNEQDVLYMVMAYVEGNNLATTIEDLEQQHKSVKLDEMLFVLAQVADALGYAHARGVVHRDVKPDNIMIRQLPQPERDGEPPLRAIVTDFGLAKLLAGGMHTATGIFIGTLPYMSPEQCTGQELDGRSDIYSLGIVLYQLATGQLPFDIQSPTDAIMKHASATPTPARLVRPGLPAGIEETINRAITKSPADRFQKAEEMAAALRRAAGQLTDDAVTRFAPAARVLSFIGLPQPAEATVLEPPQRTVGLTEPAKTAPKEQQTLRVMIEPLQVSVTPGDQAATQVTIWNGGPAAETVKVDVLDLPVGWVTVNREPLQLLPQRQVSLPLTIHLPLDNNVRPGNYPFRLLVQAVANSNRMALVSGQVVVASVERFAAELRPARLASGKVSQLLVRNDGNQPATFKVTGWDETGVVRFQALRGSLEQIAPGEVAAMDMVIDSRNRPLLGKTKVLPFELTVSTASSRRPLPGQLELRPRIPVWLIFLLVLLLFFGTAVGALLVVGSGVLSLAGSQTATMTPTPPDQATSETTPSPEAQPVAAVNQTAAATDTAVALTAAAEDDDNDGLANSLEQSLGLNPRRSDTDGDGLLDGEEVNEVESDPASRDSDGDGLADGEEVKIFRTSPTNEDSDGDGLPDGQELAEGGNPLATPAHTPTPLPEATPTPTPTETPTPMPTATATATKPPTGAGTGGGLPLGFENFGVWGIGDQANGTFTQSSERTYSGGASGKISYNFPTPDNDFVVFLQFNNIAGTPNALQLWVYGDGQGHYLNAWIIDAEGQTWQVPFGRVTHSGWAQMTGLIDVEQDWPWTHISGPDDGQVDYPIRFRGLVLDDLRNDYVGQGAIYVDELTATTQ
ncbi:MAG: protein kinase [Chloroflexi bacterium]|nr:protein kinase [Chloroflexota bacterium]MCI0579256.1 protein kinase [Chloroflexota bacterium]MCI0649381.1 protein kinase [Chloroflexota bacterium]MCI0727018.1 protein kinase [Chloroflexota bacterium]